MRNILRLSYFFLSNERRTEIRYDEVNLRWNADRTERFLEHWNRNKAEIKARQEGREEIWNMMRRIMLPRREESEAYTVDQVKEAFDVITMTDVLKMPLTDVLATDMKLMEKIKREREKLHVGDEVLVDLPFDCGIGKRAYVVNVNVGENGEYVRVLLKWEGTRIVTPDACKKTGKHNPDIVKVMNSL